ncbi:MAG: hypothetical protein GC150_17135 [Rhizobiales bacterium]|nr:hypothetical protein [Hyphomicrobiales bacterium]
MAASGRVTVLKQSLGRWFEVTILDVGRQFRWSFLPPLMVYFAAGFSGLTAIVGTFFVKDYLELSAAFLAGLAFWAGLPWTLKMPVGHLVDVLWRWKALLVHLGAGLIAASLLIMYGLVARPEAMATVMSAEAWFVVSVLLAPCGYVVQDAVADAMSVEAVPKVEADGTPLTERQAKAMHTTMQTLGRFALISGLVSVALLNIIMFAGVEEMSEGERIDVYARIYLLALAIPLVSVSGVVLAAFLRRRQRRRLVALGLERGAIERALGETGSAAEPSAWYLGGGLAFVVLALAIGLTEVPLSQEIVLTGSLAIVLVLMRRLLRELDPARARALVGTAVIIFVFRAVPLPGPGATWFEIDELGFDQSFLSVLSLIASVLTLAGMLLLRPLMASRSIAYIVVLLTVAGGLLALPNIGLYYGLHHWTAANTGGIVDARFIAVIDTAVESPLGQIAMIPMLAWIARNAPDHLKATFFAVMASFTNLALSTSSLLTRYLNEMLVVSREVRDRASGVVQTPADYSDLGALLTTVAVISVVAPLLTILLVQSSRLRTSE